MEISPITRKQTRNPLFTETPLFLQRISISPIEKCESSLTTGQKEEETKGTKSKKRRRNTYSVFRRSWADLRAALDQLPCKRGDRGVSPVTHKNTMPRRRTQTGTALNHGRDTTTTMTTTTTTRSNVHTIFVARHHNDLPPMIDLRITFTDPVAEMPEYR